MRVHHLNCMTFHLGFKNVTHCLLIDADGLLILVDTGLGLGDHTHPTSFVRAFKAFIRAPHDPEETAIRQVVKLGYAPEQVRHIVLTHLHIDHMGGLSDFPWARVHVFNEEYRAAMNPQQFSLKERFYVRTHWQHAPDWVVHSCQGERWFGFDCARVIEGLPFEVLFIPLHGHSRGHCGVAVGGHGEWLLHCGDAYVRDMQVSLDEERNPFPRWANALQQWLFPNEPVSRLRELRQQHGDEISMFCSHDREVFYRLKGR